jgi:plastocyanin
MKRLLPFLGAILLASSPGAQVTHDVGVGPIFGFSIPDLTIHVGDTVRWTWSGGLAHNVESGTGGVPDGIFTSGAPIVSPGLQYSVTFDSAFLAANPVPGNNYNYYCAIHVSFGMTAIVRVVTDYGCTAPGKSLVELGGAPHVGQSWKVGVDNPLPGAQTPGSLAFLGVALAPAPGFPCGLPFPGFHMDPVVPAGELLLSFTPPNPVATLGPMPWAGPGSPAALSLPVPPIGTLIGFELYVQGLILDPAGPNTFGVSTGMRATIGG